MKKLTFAVIFYNEEKHINDVLESLSHEIKGYEEDVDVLLIDNNSTDKSLEIVNLWKVKNSNLAVNIIQREQNHLSRARQQALEEATTDFLAFVDADCILQEGWMKSIFQSIEDWSDDVGAMGGISLYKKEIQWHEFAVSLSQLFPWGKRRGQRKLVDHMPTNNYLVSRKAALSVGGFHPLFAYVGEDLDFSVRLRESYKIYFSPNFQVFHKLPLSYVAWLRKMAFYGRAQSMVLLNNRGGLSGSKFIPLLLTIILSYSLVSDPINTQILFLIAMIIPRLRFLTLSFLFYGFGEIVGAFIFLLNYRTAGLKALTEPPRQSFRRT